MNLFDTNRLAEEIYTFLRAQTSSPREGLAVLGIALLMIREASTDGGTIEQFAEDVRRSLVETEASKMEMKETAQ